MSKNIFILGAGASFEAGAPLMNNFLDVAMDLAREKKVTDRQEEFDLVSEGRSALQATHSKSNSIDIYNMEAVFSAFEMAKMLGKLGNMPVDKINKLSKSYKSVITKTLEQTMLFSARGRKLAPPKSYKNFAELISNTPNTSIITFNYDLGVDYALYFENIKYNYCLDRTQNSAPINLIKLHGSMNWTFCSKCNQVVPWDFDNFFQKFYRTSDQHRDDIILDLGSKLTNFDHCGTSSSDAESIIVPPTWNKTTYHAKIEEVWRKASIELSEAENIFIIGYSLPSTDIFFHYLFSLGVMSNQIIRRFWVFNPDDGVKSRYTDLIGSAVSSRFEFFKNGFSESTGIIKKDFLNKKLIRNQF